MILDHLWNSVGKNLGLWEWAVLVGVLGVEMNPLLHFHFHPHLQQKLKVLGHGEALEVLDLKAKVLDLLLEALELCVFLAQTFGDS